MYMSNNDEFTKRLGKMGKQVKGYAKIRSFNDKDSAVTHDGLKVERLGKIFCDGYGWVENLNTTMHFVYEDKSKKIGRWIYMCSCGSPAGIISWKELGGVMDITGKEGYALACIAGVTSRQNSGRWVHSDGSSE